jgi:hypothetical protein
VFFGGSNVNASGLNVNFAKAYDNIGLNLFRSNGAWGVETLTDDNFIMGTIGEKQLFNYQLSNGSFEPQFTNGKYLWYHPQHPMLVGNA